MTEGIPDQYLDMIMECPFDAGKSEGAKPLREALASDAGAKIAPQVMKYIENAEELVAEGINPERATIIAFADSIVTDGEGNILREPDPEAAAETADRQQPELQGAEKK